MRIVGRGVYVWITSSARSPVISAGFWRWAELTKEALRRCAGQNGSSWRRVRTGKPVLQGWFCVGDADFTVRCQQL